ncbi:MAG TPA: carcinine hydrolase/isopenicillin-N N-acyltransferase family protein [Gemmataceae bacterium]|nr:carcinine hydrolase/isopenicillin-N N-acyltransferase family protein [Gemmataceae bacterium]
MGCDMAAALPAATGDGSTLFAHRSNRPIGEAQALFWAPRRDYAAGESVSVQRLTLPQARRTHAFIGLRPVGMWGCLHGVNEHGLAMGTTPTCTRLRGETAGLTGADLVRLTLERSATARQAVETTGGLVARCGQGPYPGCSAEDDHDNAFLIADGKEAYLLAACGAHWAVQQVGAVRALNEVCHLRKDWDRISPGLADLAIGRGWWPADGSKMDFAGALEAEGGAGRLSYGWWGLATMLLEQRSGAVDHTLMRQLLSEPGPAGDMRPSAAAGLVAQTAAAPDAAPMAWHTFGLPRFNLYFPLPVVTEPPRFLRCDGYEENGCELWRRTTREPLDRPFSSAARTALSELQACFDQRAAEFSSETAALKRTGDEQGLRRLAESFMQSNWERFEEVWGGLMGKEAAWEMVCQMDGL